MRRTLVAAREAGAAAALVPVANALTADGVEVVLVGAGQAPDVFAAALPHLQVLRAPVRVSDAAALVADVDAALTGAAAPPREEALLWAAAQCAGVPAVALLDHWSSYAERFTAEHPFDCLPYVLAVMDQAAREDLVERGFPAERLRVTGHPVLDAVAPVRASERAAARRALRCGEDRPLVLFASQPIARLYGGARDSPRWLGYTEREALATVASAMADVAPDGILVLRPHPLEDDLDLLEDVLARGIACRVERQGHPRDALAAADVVTGMFSALLLEAARAGVPTLSVRPGGGRNRFVAIHAAEIDDVRDGRQARYALAAALARGPRVAEQPPRRRPAATRNVVALLQHVAQQGRRGC